MFRRERTASARDIAIALTKDANEAAVAEKHLREIARPWAVRINGMLAGEVLANSLEQATEEALMQHGLRQCEEHDFASTLDLKCRDEMGSLNVEES